MTDTGGGGGGGGGGWNIGGGGTGGAGGEMSERQDSRVQRPTRSARGLEEETVRRGGGRSVDGGESGRGGRGVGRTDRRTGDRGWDRTAQGRGTGGRGGVESGRDRGRDGEGDGWGRGTGSGSGPGSGRQERGSGRSGALVTTGWVGGRGSFKVAPAVDSTGNAVTYNRYGKKKTEQEVLSSFSRIKGVKGVKNSDLKLLSSVKVIIVCCGSPLIVICDVIQ